MLALLAAAALQFSEADAKVAYEAAKDIVESCTPRDAGTIRGRIAANRILDLASGAGADVRRDIFDAETPAGVRSFANLYAAFRGNPTNRWVVLLSHYDTKPGSGCPGANDGASTSGLLISLANVLSNARNRTGNVLLVWTDGEESQGPHYTEKDGFQGSKRAVEHVREKGYDVQAVLCLDMLGDRDLNISIPTNGNETLARIALHAARRAGFPNLVKRLPLEVKDDHAAFLDAGYKAIDLIDFDYGSKPGANDYWHTKDDTMEHVSQASLLKSGRLVVEMLNILL